METGLCIVMTTVETSEQAAGLIDMALGEKLAACIQTRNIESHYVWQDKVCHDHEILIWFKTRTDLFEDLKRKIECIHPYDCPEIISIPINGASTAYASWMLDNLM